MSHPGIVLRVRVGEHVVLEANSDYLHATAALTLLRKHDGWNEQLHIVCPVEEISVEVKPTELADEDEYEGDNEHE